MKPFNPEQERNPDIDSNDREIQALRDRSQAISDGDSKRFHGRYFLSCSSDNNYHAINPDNTHFRFHVQTCGPNATPTKAVTFMVLPFMSHDIDLFTHELTKQEFDSALKDTLNIVRSACPQE